MPNYKKSKYSIERTQEITMRALGVLGDSSTPLTIDEIQRADLDLISVTPQKIARVLSELCEAGFVKKRMNKAKGRMIYGTIGMEMND